MAKAWGSGTLMPSAQRLVWAAKQPLGNAALGQAPCRAVCRPCGFFRMMHGGVSVPSCCAFTHRVAFEEGSGPGLKLFLQPSSLVFGAYMGCLIHSPCWHGQVFLRFACLSTSGPRNLSSNH